MTPWGVLLLALYVLLGLGSSTLRKAGRLAFVLTISVLLAAMVSYGAVR